MNALNMRLIDFWWYDAVKKVIVSLKKTRSSNDHALHANFSQKVEQNTVIMITFQNHRSQLYLTYNTKIIVFLVIVFFICSMKFLRQIL